jgi:hypothetical protein
MEDGRGSKAIYCRALIPYILIHMGKCATFDDNTVHNLYDTAALRKNFFIYLLNDGK